MTSVGRGAWTSTGKDNLNKAYVYLVGKPLDGHRETNDSFPDFNYEAVNLGVMAIQNRIIDLGYIPALVPDGVFGPATSRATHLAQEKLGVTPDGAVGPNTARALWHPMVAKAESAALLPKHILWGIARHESLLDPGAVGVSTPADRGLVQFNTSLGSVTIKQAHNPGYALPYAASRLHSAMTKYAAKGADLQLKCTIASWNAPTWANDWYNTGTAPNDKIAKYVADVLTQATTF